MELVRATLLNMVSQRMLRFVLQYALSSNIVFVRHFDFSHIVADIFYLYFLLGCIGSSGSED